jgi:hypothetical protein
VVSAQGVLFERYQYLKGKRQMAKGKWQCGTCLGRASDRLCCLKQLWQPGNVGKGVSAQGVLLGRVSVLEG